MLLIALVENAFKHGTDPDGQTTIYIALKNPHQSRKLHFSVVNAITQTSTPPAASTGIGLKNLKRRLDILYPDRHRLTVVNNGNSFSSELNIDLN